MITPNIPVILSHWHSITETDLLQSYIILYHMWSLYCCEFRFVFSFQPQFLILASTWGAVVDIFRQCRLILAKNRNIRVQLIFAAGAEENQISEWLWDSDCYTTLLPSNAQEMLYIPWSTLLLGISWRGHNGGGLHIWDQMHHETLRQAFEIPTLSFSTTPGSCHGFVLECGYSITGEGISWESCGVDSWHDWSSYLQGCATNCNILLQEPEGCATSW